MMKDDGRLVIWPAYLDKERTRAEGRIISKKSAVSKPEFDEIFKAAQVLGLAPFPESDKSYPKSWWEKSGRIMIDNTEAKTASARKIAAEIKKIRGN
jgi:Signal recognition particle 19 kDa protein